MSWKRLFLLAALAALLAASAWPPGWPRSARAQEAVTLIRSLPAWVAPDGLVPVAGVAAPGEQVGLWIGRRKRAETTSGPEGHFRFRVRAPRSPGRYPVRARVAAGTVELGSLLVRPLVLAAVGDVTFGDGVATAIATHGARYPWVSVAPVLRRADLAVANLEGAVSRRGAPVPGKRYTFRGPPHALRAAGKYAGIDLVSLANNHSLDYGRTAFLDTIAHARRSGITPFGGGRDLTRARRPRIVIRGGMRIAFLGFSDVRPLGFDAGAGRPGATPALTHYIGPDVRAARRRADVVVVYFHWGVERSTVPSGRQRYFAGVARDAGAQVVLGAHPHVLQPVVRTRRRLVAWSLGNFVFAASSPGTGRTGILMIRLGARGVLGHGFRGARIHWVQPRLGG